MLICPICNNVCRGHLGEKVDNIIRFKESPSLQLEISRDGLQPKGFIELNDGSKWMAKYDRFEIALPNLNEWMTMQLVKAAGFHCEDYGLALLKDGNTPRTALLVRKFAFKSGEDLVSGLDLLHRSAAFCDKARNSMETDSPEEYRVAFHANMMELKLLEVIDIFSEVDVDDLEGVFRFFVMSEALNHTDCHLGNVGFTYTHSVDHYKVAPVYDVSNFGVYKESRDVLRASENLISPDYQLYKEMAERCGVDSWEAEIQKMLSSFKLALPSVLQAVEQTTWLREVSVPDVPKLRGPRSLEQFLEQYQETLERSFASIETELASAPQHFTKLPAPKQQR